MTESSGSAGSGSAGSAGSSGSAGAAAAPAVRDARASDVDELVRLRAEMYLAMGHGTDVPGWRVAAAEAFHHRLAHDDDFLVVVVDAADGDGLVASATATVEHYLPGPTDLDGRRGVVMSVSVQPPDRRRGLGEAVTRALVGRLAARGVHRVDLQATAMGEPLYRRLGFVDRAGTTLALRPPRSVLRPAGASGATLCGPGQRPSSSGSG